jgi:AraC-like DNA-binding protein
VDRADKSCEVFSGHWHEQLELHYIVQGGGDFRLGQQSIHVSEGDLLISNRNEFHSGYSTQIPYMSNVIIFDMGDLSQELAKKNYVFQSVIRGDGVIHDLIQRIFAEAKCQESGYKQLCKALVTELFVYLCRNYVAEMMPERDSAKRKKDLERLNAVLGYIEANYNQRITLEQLADMVCLSEDRFGHLFREGVGQPPLQYINAMRLRKALNMLKTNQYTVTEVADAVGFRDYNHFGRLFRKQYGCTHNEIKRGMIEKYSGNV